MQRLHAFIYRGGETFVDIDAAEDLLDEAERQTTGVLGLEGSVIDDDGVYPACDRIADLSDVADAHESVGLARDLVRRTWRTPPTPADRMSAHASGRHMLTIVLGA